MKRLVASALAAATIGAGAFAVGSATGQGTGGTLGAGAVGTKTFEVRIKESQFGVNCGNLPQSRCFRVAPRLATVGAGNGQIFDGSNRVGTALFANITARKVSRQSTQDIFMATITFDNKVDSLSVLGPSAESENNSDGALPYAIIGGTGIYAGARGVVTESNETEGRGEFRITLTFTFIP
jgi:hypothetical protein